MTAVTKVPKLIWKRLPWIIVWIFVITGCLFLWDFYTHRYASGESFLNYTSFKINSAEEHKDIPFEACKSTDFEYRVTGNRKIYVIPPGKGEIDKVLVKTYPLDSIISPEKCVNAFISKEQYDFTPGNYQVYTTFNFTVKYGNPKSVTFKSNVFQVFKVRPTTPEDIQAHINDLKMQILELEKELEEILKKQSSTRPEAQKQSVAVQEPSKSSQQPEPSPTPEQPENEPQENPRSIRERLIDIIGDLL